MGTTAQAIHIFGTTAVQNPDHVTDSADNVLIEGSLEAQKNIHANKFYQDGNAGFDGTFTNADGDTVTVSYGIVTDVS